MLSSIYTYIHHQQADLEKNFYFFNNALLTPGFLMSKRDMRTSSSEGVKTGSHQPIVSCINYVHRWMYVRYICDKIRV